MGDAFWPTGAAVFKHQAWVNTIFQGKDIHGVVKGGVDFAMLDGGKLKTDGVPDNKRYRYMNVDDL